ncbi:MAG: hypothetical protein QXL01_03190 [Thermoplasmatales archaeon]
MTLTLKDIRDRLKLLDEVTLLEILDISSEDIVDRFEDLIEDRADTLEILLEEDSLYYGEEGENSEEGPSDEETFY